MSLLLLLVDERLTHLPIFKLRLWRKVVISSREVRRSKRSKRNPMVTPE
jgi:hypothetical protein